MRISIKTSKGKNINLDFEDSSETIDIKIHGDSIRQVVLGQDAALRIFVKNLWGKIFTLKVEKSETIEQVKAKIHEQGGPPVSEQNLYFQGHRLMSNRTIADYNFKTDSNLVMTSIVFGC